MANEFHQIFWYIKNRAMQKPFLPTCNTTLYQCMHKTQRAFSDKDFPKSHRRKNVLTFKVSVFNSICYKNQTTYLVIAIIIIMLKGLVMLEFGLYKHNNRKEQKTFQQKLIFQDSPFDGMSRWNISYFTPHQFLFCFLNTLWIYAMTKHIAIYTRQLLNQV